MAIRRPPTTIFMFLLLLNLLVVPNVVEASMCGCSSCNEVALQDRDGSEFSCGMRIQRLMDNYGDSEQKACEASSKYPGMPQAEARLRPCSYEACHPKGCKKETAEAAPSPKVQEEQPPVAAVTAASIILEKKKEEAPTNNLRTTPKTTVSTTTTTTEEGTFWLNMILLAVFVSYGISEVYQRYKARNKKPWERASSSPSKRRVGGGSSRSGKKKKKKWIFW